MNRNAYLALTIKAVDDDARQIEGWATRPEIDRVGDIVDPTGAEYSLPLPFLLDHDRNLVVGEVDRVKVSAEGIKFWAHIKKVPEPGAVKELVDKAWHLVKYGLRKSVSIGFTVKEYDVLPTGGLKFTAWEWLELSAVSVPALAGASITSVKNYQPGAVLNTVPHEIDTALRAASGKAHGDAQPAQPAPEAAAGAARIVRLHDPARVRAKPFVIRKIHC